MKVKIKTWDAMVKEFGFDGGFIACDYGFTEGMEKQMPKDRYIQIETDIYGVYKWGRWDISEDMI